MHAVARLRLSILLSDLLYLAIQVVIWSVCISVPSIISGPYRWFLPSAVFAHIVIGAILWWRHGDFRLTGTREPLRKVNLACHFTLFRLSCVPTILFLAIAVSRGDTTGVALFAVVAAAFLSDLFDGQIARRLNQRTDIGAYLDSSTDYAVLVVLSIAFLIMEVTPLWYFAVLMVRLLGFAIAMTIITLIRRELHPDTTILGKAAVFSAMATYAFELARHASLPIIGDNSVVFVVEVVSAAIIVVSVVDKFVYLVRRYFTRTE